MLLVRSPDRCRSSGFTLLETLAALTILAIAFVALFESYSAGLKATHVSETYGRARILAQSLLSEAVAGWGQIPAIRTGRTGNFSWSVAIAPARAPWAALNTKQNWQLNRVTVTVGWDKSRRLELETLKLGRSNE